MVHLFSITPIYLGSWDSPCCEVSFSPRDKVHTRRLTWNLKFTQVKRRLIFQTISLSGSMLIFGDVVCFFFERVYIYIYIKFSALRTGWFLGRGWEISHPKTKGWFTQKGKGKSFEPNLHDFGEPSAKTVIHARKHTTNEARPAVFRGVIKARQHHVKVTTGGTAAEFTASLFYHLIHGHDRRSSWSCCLNELCYQPAARRSVLWHGQRPSREPPDVFV